MSDHPWQKSTYSPDGTNCLYIAAPTPTHIRLRESDTPGTILTTTPPVLGGLLHSLKQRQSAASAAGVQRSQ